MQLRIHAYKTMFSPKYIAKARRAAAFRLPNQVLCFLALEFVQWPRILKRHKQVLMR